MHSKQKRANKIFIKKKLNLGCGDFKKKGYVNLDRSARVDPEVKHDLNNYPYPFEDNHFEKVLAYHVLEHLDDPFNAMKEIYRICKNNALIIVKVPHFSRGFTHPEHKRGFGVSFPLYFNSAFNGGYQGFELKLKKIKFSWFAQPYLKKITLSPVVFFLASITGKLFDLFANLSPYFCSRVWCYLVGGFEEIEFRFLVKK
jgi:SAM-dependent methyltransferase